MKTFKEFVTEAAEPDVVGELRSKYDGKEIGKATFQVSFWKGVCRVEWDITERRTTSVGIFQSNQSTVNSCNRLISEIASTYSKHKEVKSVKTTLCDKDKCQSSDNNREENDGSAYSEYEVAIGGSCVLTL